MPGCRRDSQSSQWKFAACRIASGLAFACRRCRSIAAVVAWPRFTCGRRRAALKLRGRRVRTSSPSPSS
eukprot:1265712-Pyramimonas_sp.AAC.1